MHRKNENGGFPLYQRQISGASPNQRLIGGFTLIELLVIIAIIGLLSSIVLASLNIARLRARDGNVRANLNTVRSEIELFYLNNNEWYGDPISPDECDITEQDFYNTVPNIEGAIKSAELNGGLGSTLCAIGSGGDSWAVSVPLASSGSWCVSSIGISKEGQASGGGNAPAFCEE